MKKESQEYFFLQPREEAAMRVLWDTEDALSASEIAAGIPDRSWPASSIQGILRSLEKKHAVRVDAVTKLGKSYGRLFRPSMSANEYAAMQFQRYYRNGRTDFRSMLSSLLGNTGANNKEIAESLQSLLEEYREKEH